MEGIVSGQIRITATTGPQAGGSMELSFTNFPLSPEAWEHLQALLVLTVKATVPGGQ